MVQLHEGEVCQQRQVLRTRTKFVERRYVDGCGCACAARLWSNVARCLPRRNQSSDNIALFPEVFVAFSLHRSFSFGTVKARSSSRSSDSLVDCCKDKIDRTDFIAFQLRYLLHVDANTFCQQFRYCAISMTIRDAIFERVYICYAQSTDSGNPRIGLRKPWIYALRNNPWIDCAILGSPNEVRRVWI